MASLLGQAGYMLSFAVHFCAVVHNIDHELEKYEPTEKLETTK